MCTAVQQIRLIELCSTQASHDDFKYPKHKTEGFVRPLYTVYIPAGVRTIAIQVILIIFGANLFFTRL